MIPALLPMPVIALREQARKATDTVKQSAIKLQATTREVGGNLRKRWSIIWSK